MHHPERPVLVLSALDRTRYTDYPSPRNHVSFYQLENQKLTDRLPPHFCRGVIQDGLVSKNRISLERSNWSIKPTVRSHTMGVNGA